MSLDLTPRSLREQVLQPGLELRRKLTNQSAVSKQLYRGPYQPNGTTNADQTYENHNSEYVANLKPHLVHGVPSAKLTDMGAVDEETAVDESALRSLIHTTRLKTQLDLVAIDMMFDFGVMLAHTEPTPGFVGGASKPRRPRLTRLSPTMVGRDPRAPEFGGMARAEFHMIVGSYRSMVEERDANGLPKYKFLALNQLSRSEGLEEVRKDLMQDGIAVAADDSDTVVYFEVWCREEQCWVCLGFGSGGDAIPLRSEQPYEGPLDGPYTWFGLGIDPDQVYPIAPLTITRRQVEELNAHKAQAARDAATAKRLGVVGGTAYGVVGTVQDAPSGSILSLPGFNGQYQTIDLGGVNPATVEYIEWASGKLDRTSGLAEMQRGNITGATAAEVTEAASFIDSRLKEAQSMMQEPLAVALGKVVELMHTDGVAFPFSLRNPQSGQVIRATYFGEPYAPDPTYPWRTRPTVKIEPYSMEYVNQQTLRAQMQETMGQIVTIMEASMTLPALKPREMVQDLMNTMNVDNGADKYADWQMHDLIRMAPLMAGSLPGEGMPEDPNAQPNGPAKPKGPAGGTKSSPAGASQNRSRGQVARGKETANAR